VRLGPLLALSAAAAVLAAPARADDVSAAELRALAARAADDPAALAALRRVDSVDGRPFDAGRLLAAADGDELERRLEVLAGGGGAAGADPGRARAEAAEILSERRFREEEVPRPFRGALAWVGDRLRPVGEAAIMVVDWLAGPLPGGRSTFWVLVSLGALAVAAVVASRVVRGRAHAATERARAAGGGAADPRRLEREADEAERRGELERALRLRFRAGLHRLQRAEAIPARDSLTSGEVAAALRSDDFDRAASTFDEVVYGRRPAVPRDVESSREAWARVLERAAAR
jgi:hypothetical protein